LGEEGNSDDDSHSLEITLGSEQTLIARASIGELLHSQSLLDLVHLKLDERVLSVAATVVLADDLSRFLNSAVVDEPSGGLGDEHDEEELEKGRKTLEKGWDSPSPVVLNSEGTESGPGGD
jgi:hypothetical protein